MGKSIRNEDLECAIAHFHSAGSWLEDSTTQSLEMAMCSILSLASHKTVTALGWRPLSFADHQRLLAAIYRALSAAVVDINTDLGSDRLRKGLRNVVTIADNLRTGEFDNDRHHDAVSEAKILIHWLRICQHRDAINNRRRRREHNAVARLTLMHGATSPFD